jgi:hypothetical protein
VSYYLVTVESTHVSADRLRISPPVRIKELAARVADDQVPVLGDKVLLYFPDGQIYQAPLAAFLIETRVEGGKWITRSNPEDPEYTVVIGYNDQAPEVPAGTRVWLDESVPTGGHRTKGWKQIIETIASWSWKPIVPEG